MCFWMDDWWNDPIGHHEPRSTGPCPIECSYWTSPAEIDGAVSDWTLLLDITSQDWRSCVRLSTLIGHHQPKSTGACPIEHSYRTSRAEIDGAVSDWTILLDITSRDRRGRVRLNNPIGHHQPKSTRLCPIEQSYWTSPAKIDGAVSDWTILLDTTSQNRRGCVRLNAPIGHHQPKSTGLCPIEQSYWTSLP